MARTKQTARKSASGKAPRRILATKSAKQFRQQLTGRQANTYANAKPSEQKKTSYINYENMFYSYFFPTGPRSTQLFEPRFTMGTGKHPISGEREEWLGMSFNSKFDGDGIKVHGRPHLNLSIVLDISGSMSSMFEMEEGSRGTTKLDVAKTCLQTLTDQLKASDRFGVVTFNDRAAVYCPMKVWSSVSKSKLKTEIGQLRAGGLTCLTAAIDCATDMFKTPFEHTNSTSRIIFLTDLCSTVDSVNDEKRLLSTIKKNADRGIYTTVVGIGMDLNVRLVEEISKTAGAKYCSVDSAHEFQQIMNKEFDYDTTILAFDIKVELQSPDYQLVKGYGSPELNAVKPGKPVVISSEFPCWQNEEGETKGGMMLFKMKPKKQRKTPAKEIKVCVSWREANGWTHKNVINVNISDSLTDTGTRKAVLLVHYVDLHNDYVHDCRRNKMKFLEMFQSFRDHFVKELEEMGDKSYTTFNKGDLELVDKIIELEEHPEADSSDPAPGPSGPAPSRSGPFGSLSLPSWPGVSSFFWQTQQAQSTSFSLARPAAQLMPFAQHRQPTRRGKVPKRLTKPKKQVAFALPVRKQAPKPKPKSPGRKQAPKPKPKSPSGKHAPKPKPKSLSGKQAPKPKTKLPGASSVPQAGRRGGKKKAADCDTAGTVALRRSSRVAAQSGIPAPTEASTTRPTRKRKASADPCPAAKRSKPTPRKTAPAKKTTAVARKSTRKRAK